MKPSIWRLFSLLMIGSMVLSLAGITAVPQPAAAAPLSEEIVLPERAAGKDASLQLEPATAAALASAPSKGQVMYELKDATGPATYIVQLEAAPLASYRGEVAGLTATSPVATGAAKLDVNSAASRAYRAYLAEERTAFLQHVQQNVGRTVKVLYTYDVAYNGVAVELTPEEAAEVAKMPGVRRVIRNFERYIQTDTTPEFLNAWGIWDGTNTGVLSGTMGEGIVAGIIDTGINMDNRAFAATGDDGYTHTNPRGQFYGWCDPAHPSYNPALVCNDKLIGVYSYPDSGNNPEDDNSHGSHTASTTAGNVLYDVEYEGYVFPQISGMAPHANIIAFDVCTGSGCQLTSILAAINDATADQVDVINYSIGGGPTNPWGDPDSEAYLNARDAGVFVATSAGNTGSGYDNVGSPANSPWLIAVANTTIGRIIANTLDVTGPGTVPPELEGIGAIRGPEGPDISTDIEADVIYSGDVDPTNILGCDPFPAGSFTDSIALIQRGDCTFAIKVTNAANAGAVAVVVFNHSGGPPMVMGGLEGTTIPSVFVTLDDGAAIRDWIQAETDPTVRINAGSDAVYNADWADIVSAGSLIGPNVNANILKPDIGAPGTNIFAAYAGGSDDFGMMSGTSMASPHVAGAAALVRALYPTWTPAEVQSALMMTSWMDVRKPDATTPADPFDTGAGRLDLTGAALAGLVLDETTANFVAADPALDGDPTTLNLASLASSACLGTCAWERVFRNTTDQAVEWEVTFTGDVAMAADPVTFTIAADDTQMVEFTADVTGEADGVWLFGMVILTPDDGSPELHLPVAVMPTSGILPGLVQVNTRRNAGSQMIEGLQAVEILTMTIETFGLVQADLHDILLDQDPTNGDPYDNLTQVYYDLVTVPAGAKRLVAEIIASEAPDVDLFVLYDTGGGNFAEVCVGTTSSWNEYCDLTDPDAGTYLVIVQNWQGSANQPDAIVMAVGVVPGTDVGNMFIDGPDSVPEMESFDLQLFWDTPAMVAGDRWYGAFSLGTEPGSEGNLGAIPVNVIRHDDDVVKTADKEWAFYGDVVEYTIAVQSNVTPEDLAYMLTDTIPAGLTYVPGSAAATAGVVNVTGDTLTWTGTLYAPTAEYMMTTSLVDPACAMPLANDGAYLNLAAFGIMPQAAIQGDTLWFSTFSTGDPFTYWGNQYTGMNFTDDGFAFFGSTPGDEPWVNQDIPSPADPNNLLAMFWNDWEVVYDISNPAALRGVSIATLGGITGGGVIDFSGVQPFGDDTQTVDFQVFAWRTPDPALGAPDIVFAYTNINLDEPITVGTIGIENALGTEGIKYAYDDIMLETLEDGMGICFDWFVPTADPVLITYQVTVDEPGVGSPLTNEVIHEVDNEGSLPAETAFDLYILGDAVKDVTATLIDPGELLTYTIVLTAGPAIEMWSLYDAIPDGFSFVSVDGATYDAGTHSISWSGPLGSGLVAVLEEGFESAAFPPDGWVRYNLDGGGTQWVRSTARFNSGTASAVHNFSYATPDQDGWLVTPLVTLPDNATLSFWESVNWSGDWDTHSLWICTSDCDSPPTNWTWITDYVPLAEDTWMQQGPTDLSAYAGQDVRLAFRYEGYGADDWFIDDIVIEGLVDNPTHTITLTLQGEIPGTYVNVAEISTQGVDIEVEAEAVVIYGPIPAWEKEIWIDEAGPFGSGVHYVVPGNMVTIVDRVSVDFNDAITFTLVEAWDALLSLVDYEADFGDVTPDAGMLTWDVENGDYGTWYTLTKTFEVLAGFGWDGMITETLEIEGYPVTLETPVAFIIPALLDKAGPATADTGEIITYTLNIEADGPIVSFMELVDVLPDGVEYVADSLAASYGTAWYDAGANAVYWNTAMGMAYNTQQAGATSADNLAATTKQADMPAGDAAVQSAHILLDMVTLLEEGFEGGVMPPAGWSVIDGTDSTNHWTLVNTTDNNPAWIRTGAYAGWVNYQAMDQDEWLISPLMDFTGVMTPTAEFWVYANNNWPTAGLEFLVIDSGGAFTDTLWQQLDQAWPYPSVYRQVVVDLSAYEEQSVYLAWRYIGNDGDSLALDDISIMGEVEPPPSEVTITFEAIVTAAAGEIITNTAELSYMGTVQEAQTVLVVNGYTLDVNVVGAGTVDVDPDLDLYSYGDVVTLTATADLGWTFAGWSGDAMGTDEMITVTIMGDHVITATFTQDEYTLDVIVDPPGSGTVDVDPDQETYVYGDEVVLTAIADPGWTFAGWSGDALGTDEMITVTIMGDHVITATFTQDEYTLDVIVDPPGSGTVDVNPDQETYVYGDEVVLTAMADPGWTFAGWSGDAMGTDEVITVTVEGDTVITATFTQDEYTLDVIVDPPGSGTVDVDPVGPYNYGDVVTLTANANTGWLFDSWSDALGTDEVITITIEGDTVITATFVELPSGLTISKSVTPDAELRPGDTVTYTIILENNGQVEAIGVILTDTLPSAVEFGAFVENEGIAVETGGVITWSGNLAVGETLTIVFTATVSAEAEAFQLTIVPNQVVFTSENAGSGEDTASFTIQPLRRIFLPLVMRAYTP